MNDKLNIETELYKVKDGVLTWVNDKVEYMRVPEGVKKIDSYVFSELYGRTISLKTITIPNTVKEISTGAFQRCNQLRNVELSDGLESIGVEAFNGCTRLESIKIPKTVKIIGDNAFLKCMRLYDIELLDGLKEICYSGFSKCICLESVTIPKTVKRIGSKAFENCRSLKKVTLLDGLEVISEQAFSKCRKLEEITIPSSVKKMGRDIFEDCERLEKITIRYKNYEELMNLITNSVDFFCSNNSSMYETMGICAIHNSESKTITKPIKLIFEGPKLSFGERIVVKRFIKDKKAEIIFEEKDNVLIENVEEATNDIQALVDKINNLCTYLPDNIKNSVLNKVNDLLDAYQKDMDSLKPTYNGVNKSNTLDLNIDKDIKFLKPKLQADLEAIILNLSSVDTLIEYLEELNRYKNLLNSDIDSESLGDSLEDNIKNIVYLSNRLSDKKKEENLNKLSNYIDNTVNNTTSSITKTYDRNSINLSNDIDYKQEFMFNISNLYDEVNSEYKKIEQYRLLLDNLNSNIYSYTDGDTITDIINSIRYIISILDNNEFKKETEEKFDKIQQKYINRINNIINDDELLNTTNYNDIERSLREEIQLILESIKEKETGIEMKMDIAEQLNMAIIHIIDHPTEKIDEDKDKLIKNYIISIFNKIEFNEEVDIESKIEIRMEIMKKIEELKDLVENKEIKSKEEYSSLLYEIKQALIEIDLDIDEFIEESEEYNRYSK